jgi:multicomponent Na+:H+ antiporter subunit G
MPFNDILSLICLLTGTFFLVVAAMGMWVMPDLFTRMSATTKAATVGLGFLLLAVIFHFPTNIALIVRSVAIFLFLMITAPVSAHMIGRAAYGDGVKMCPETEHDELKPYYDQKR